MHKLFDLMNRNRKIAKTIHFCVSSKNDKRGKFAIKLIKCDRQKNIKIGPKFWVGAQIPHQTVPSWRTRNTPKV